MKLIVYSYCGSQFTIIVAFAKTKLVESTTRMKELERCFEVELLQRASNIRKQRPPVVMPERWVAVSIGISVRNKSATFLNSQSSTMNLHSLTLYQ